MSIAAATTADVPVYFEGEDSTSVRSVYFLGLFSTKSHFMMPETKPEVKVKFITCSVDGADQTQKLLEMRTNQAIFRFYFQFISLSGNKC